MLDRALINHPGLRDGEVDIGRILDAMLYYGRVSLILDARSFTGLWHRLGQDEIRTLLSHPSLQVEVTSEMPGVINNKRGGILTHAPIYFSAAGQEGKFLKHGDTARSLHQLLNNTAPTSIADVRKALKGLQTTRYGRLLGQEANDNRLFEALVRDLETMKLFLREWVERHGGTVREPTLDELEISVEKLGAEYLIWSNVPLSAVADGVVFDQEWGSILPELQGYSHNLYLAESRSADVITPNAIARIASARIDLSLMRAAQSEEKLTAFEQVAFGEGRPFGDAFEAGEIDLKTALNVIDQSRRFREWLDGLPPESDLLREYHLALAKEPGLAGLKGSTARFAIFTGGGLLAEALIGGGVGVASGVGLSFFDSFLVDKLIKGWRPSVFVENTAKAIGKK